MNQFFLVIAINLIMYSNWFQKTSDSVIHLVIQSHMVWLEKHETNFIIISEIKQSSRLTWIYLNMKLKGLECSMWVCCLPVGCVVLFRHCCYFSMPFYHLLVSLLGVKMTSVGGGKPRRQSWSPFHVKLGENTHLRTVTHCHTHILFYHEGWAVCLNQVIMDYYVY